MQSETEALIEQDPEAAECSAKRRSLLDPGDAFPGASIPRSCSRDSMRSIRRASSLDDIDGMRAEWSGRPGDPRSSSSECWRAVTLHLSHVFGDKMVAFEPPLKLCWVCLWDAVADVASLCRADLKSSVLNSTSDSDLVRHRAVSRIPQVTLSFGSDRMVPPSPTEIEIIAPSKIKDRTQNVTEKVTQVTQVRRRSLKLLEDDSHDVSLTFRRKAARRFRNDECV